MFNAEWSGCTILCITLILEDHFNLSDMGIIINKIFVNSCKHFLNVHEFSFFSGKRCLEVWLIGQMSSTCLASKNKLNEPCMKVILFALSWGFGFVLIFKILAVLTGV